MFLISSFFISQRKTIKLAWMKIMNKCCSLENIWFCISFFAWYVLGNHEENPRMVSIFIKDKIYNDYSEEYQYLIMVFSIKTFRHIKCNQQFCKSFANMSAKNKSMSQFLRSFRELLSIIIDSFIHSFWHAHSLTVLRNYPL